MTNGAVWRIYKIAFCQPISADLLFECDLLTLNAKNRPQVESLYLLAREGQSKSILHDFHAQQQAKSRYLLGALILSEPVLDVVRRELRRAFPDVKVDEEELRQQLADEVLKRDVIEGEKADDARKRITKAQGRALRARRAAAGAGNDTETVEASDGVAEV